MLFIALNRSFIILNGTEVKEILLDTLDYDNKNIQNSGHSKHGCITASSQWKSDKFSDGLLAIALDCKCLLLYRTHDQYLLHTWTCEKTASCVAFHPDGTAIVLGDKAGNVYLADILKDGYGSIRQLLGHVSLLTCLSFAQSENSLFLLSGDIDEKLRISCYPNTYNIQAFCLGHQAALTSVAVLCRGYRMVSADANGRVILWNVRSGLLLHMLDLCENNEENMSPSAAVIHCVYRSDDPVALRIYVSLFESKEVFALGVRNNSKEDSDLHFFVSERYRCASIIHRVLIFNDAENCCATRDSDTPSVYGLVDDANCPFTRLLFQPFTGCVVEAVESEVDRDLETGVTPSQVMTVRSLAVAVENNSALRQRLLEIGQICPVWRSRAAPNSREGEVKYHQYKEEHHERVRERQRRSSRMRKRRRFETHLSQGTVSEINPQDELVEDKEEAEEDVVSDSEQDICKLQFEKLNSDDVRERLNV